MTLAKVLTVVAQGALGIVGCIVADLLGTGVCKLAKVDDMEQLGQKAADKLQKKPKNVADIPQEEVVEG